jgi:hypothetical protein
MSERAARMAAETKPAPQSTPMPLWRSRWSLVLALMAVVLLLFVVLLGWQR